MAEHGLKAALVVDDDDVTRKLLVALMRKFGFSVVAVCDGLEALKVAREKLLDCILMDIDMPKMTGLEATRAIRGLPGARGRVPIIAVTARITPDEVAECAQAGMDAHLGKPVAIQDLHRLVSATLTPPCPPAAQPLHPSGLSAACS